MIKAALIVIATASRPETQAWVGELGAHHVIDHRQPLARQVANLGIGAPAFVFSTTHTDEHIEQIAELIALRTHINAQYDGSKSKPLVDDHTVTDTDAQRLGWTSQWTPALQTQLSYGQSRDRYETTPSPYLTITKVKNLALTGSYKIAPGQQVNFQGERIEDGPWFAEILREYRRQGFLTAIDDFGAGYAGLRLLSDFQPDLIKLDMDLVRHVDTLRPRQAIARAVIRLAQDLGIRLVVEGVETVGERDFFLHEGVTLFQGYLFSRPQFRGLASAPLRG